MRMGERSLDGSSGKTLSALAMTEAFSLPCNGILLLPVDSSLQREWLSVLTSSLMETLIWNERKDRNFWAVSQLLLFFMCVINEESHVVNPSGENR